MAVNLNLEHIALRLWFLSHRTHELLRRCEDRVFGEYNLTTEHYTVLAIIKYLDDPVRITDVARWSGRSTNSVSMIIDRMVKAGLVKRVRDRKDRRVVFLTATSRAEKAYVVASVAGWKLIQEILSPLSDKDKLTLIRLLETLRDKTYDYLDSGEVTEEVKVNDTANMARIMKEVAKYKSPSVPEAKRRGGGKKKTIR